MENKQKLTKECDFCDSDATCLCFDCIIYFCDNCYKFIHDKKKNSSHQKIIIDPYIQIELKCSEHPKIPITLFCLDEKGNYKYIIFTKY